MATKRNKPSVIDKESFESLQELFDAIRGETEKFKKAMQNAQRDIAKTQEQLQKRAVAQYVRAMRDGEETSLYHIEALRKKLIKDNEKYLRDTRLKMVYDIYDEEIKNNMKSAKKRKQEELIAQKELNEAILKMYSDREAKGEKLTKTEQEDKEQKERDVQLAKQLEGIKTATQHATAVMSNLTNAVSSAVTTYSKYQGSINARLQGANVNSSASDALRFGTNTFGILENRLNSAVGINPYVKNETMMNNLNDLVKMGIASNVEQKAFLQSIKDDIAETFDVANSALLRIVRLQQSDSTAARLGMEAYLTRFLNSMVDNTEYLTTTFDSVQEALIEASSQMSIESSTQFEYVVQKWLGALTGTGLAESTATQIAEAMGYLGSGNVSALNNSSMMNLLTIASTRAGMNIGDLLNEGLTAKTANALLESIANYMVEIGSSGTNVVKSQLAQTFGLNISDITAAQQLSSSFKDISKSMMSFDDMYGELSGQLAKLPSRLSTGEMIQNMFDNSMFSLSKGIAENPALMAIWQIADMVQSVSGGINIPSIGVLGNFMDLNTTVENLVKLGVVGVSSFNWIGDMLSGLSSTFAPSSMLSKLGITSGNTAISRGTGLSTAARGLNKSTSSYVGTNSGNDMYQQTLQHNYEEAQNNEEIQPQASDETKELPTHVAQIDANLAELLANTKKILERLDGEFEISNYKIREGATDWSAWGF